MSTNGHAPHFLLDPGFIERKIMPLLNGSAGAYTAEVNDDRDPTKITARYTLADGSCAYAKAYSGDYEDGAHAHRTMSALWANGFGPDSRYRICEPLGWLADDEVILTRGVHGTNLEDHQGTDSDEQFAGVRESARWLAQLHSTPVCEGRPWAIWENFARLARRLLKAASEGPAEEHDRLLDMLERLMEIAPGAQDPSRLVQTHGQFRDLHVYVADETISVIDFDRSRPADPAKDLDEFLHRLRWKTFKRTDKSADALTRAFLEEYVSGTSEENLVNLPFYAGYHALYSLSRWVKSEDPADPDWQRGIDFFTEEFEAALGGRLGQ